MTLAASCKYSSMCSKLAAAVVAAAWKTSDVTLNTSDLSDSGGEGSPCSLLGITCLRQEWVFERFIQGAQSFFMSDDEERRERPAGDAMWLTLTMTDSRSPGGPHGDALSPLTLYEITGFRGNLITNRFDIQNEIKCTLYKVIEVSTNFNLFFNKTFWPPFNLSSDIICLWFTNLKSIIKQFCMSGYKNITHKNIY